MIWGTIYLTMEAGAKCAGLCRKHGVSHSLFYAWKLKFSGMRESQFAIGRMMTTQIALTQGLDMKGQKPLPSARFPQPVATLRQTKAPHDTRLGACPPCGF